jgi:ribosomal protein L7Ae-like RNA K-turn-binding protein
MDRMYSDNGIGRHIIRNLPDGTQEMLHPTTFELIRTFCKNEKKGVPNHYIKQKAELIRLIPGDPKYVAVVLMIFHLHYVDGWSYHQIALHLNDSHIPSANGKEWHTDTVKDILRSPIYVGRAIRGRKKTGIYFVTAEGQPQPSEVTLEELANNGRVKAKLRAREEWLERIQPHLEDYLPDPAREIARVRIEQYLESIADAKPKNPNRDRHRNHFYLLKGILRSKQGNYLMTGRVGGKKGKERRTYAVNRGEKVPKSNNILKRRVPADALEEAVVAIVREVVRSVPDLKSMLKELIVQNMKTVQDDVEKPEQLEKEIKRKQKQLALLSDDVQLEEDDDVLTRKCDKIKADIRSLRLRLQQIPQTKQMDKAGADAIAAKFAKELLDSAESLGNARDVQTYRLLELLISRMQVDLETLEVEIDFAFPSWFGGALQHGPLGLDSLSAYRQRHEAHPENTLKLADYHCQFNDKSRDRCVQCRRRPAA